jgi:hypothetical protein
MAANAELTQKRDDLAAAAQTAIDLASKERTLADEQHIVAHELEKLADNLTDQVVAVEVAIEADASATAGSPSGKKYGGTPRLA